MKLITLSAILLAGFIFLSVFLYFKKKNDDVLIDKDILQTCQKEDFFEHLDKILAFELRYSERVQEEYDPVSHGSLKEYLAKQESYYDSLSQEEKYRKIEILYNKMCMEKTTIFFALCKLQRL